MRFWSSLEYDFRAEFGVWKENWPRLFMASTESEEHPEARWLFSGSEVRTETRDERGSGLKRSCSTSWKAPSRAPTPGFSNEESGVSAHYGIGKDGEVHQY